METGILRVTETASGEVAATEARLHMTVSGHNFVYGNAALEKCAEVKALVLALTSAAVAPEHIQVKGVRVKMESGLLTKSSSGVYQLLVQVKDTAKLGDVLGIVASAKNVTLDYLDWHFEEQESKVKLTEEALHNALLKAERMVKRVGHRLLGIKSCSDTAIPVQDSIPAPVPFSGFLERSAPRMRASADIGTEFRGSKEIEVVVTVEFFISRMDG